MSRPAAGDEDYHDPLAGLCGAPPARSALTLRLALALFGVVACVSGAIILLLLVDVATWLVTVLLVGAVLALVDIAVVTRRLRRERR